MSRRNPTREECGRKLKNARKELEKHKSATAIASVEALEIKLRRVNG